MKNLFIGDSITEGFPLSILFPDKSILNRGISGISSAELIDRFTSEWFDKDTEVVFICIGTNDLARNTSDNEILKNIKILCKEIDRKTIYLTSLFPTKENLPRPNNRINKLNFKIHELTTELGVHYLHLNPYFKDEKGVLRKEYTNDGLHLTKEAYSKWASLLHGLLI